MRNFNEPVEPEYLEAVTNRPIPGMSWTNDPEKPYPFERPPKHTKLKETQIAIFDKLTSEETYPIVMERLSAGMPIMDITQNILYAGFRNGDFNPDLMLLLAEPVAYMLMALAESEEIPYVIDREDAQSDSDMPIARVAQENAMPTVQETIRQKTPTQMQSGVLPKEITSKIADRSLLKKEEPPVRSEQSLLGEANSG